MPTFPYDVNIDAATVALGAFALCRREAGFAQGARSSKVQLLSALVGRRLFSLLENCFTSFRSSNRSFLLQRSLLIFFWQARKIAGAYCQNMLISTVMDTFTNG